MPASACLQARCPAGDNRNPRRRIEFEHARMRPAPAPTAKHGANRPIREDWLAQWSEAILEPNLPIVDPHHHLWDRPGWRYLLEEFLADVNSGHRIVATVFVQCRSMYRRDGPEELRPLGETEFVNGVAAMSASVGCLVDPGCGGRRVRAHM